MRHFSVAVAFLLLLSACAVWPGSREAILVIQPASGETMPAAVLDQVRSRSDLTAIEPYLLIEAEPHPVIGVEPGAPLRVITMPDFAHGRLYRGQMFREADRGQLVAIPGRSVAKEDFGSQTAMAGMRHTFEVGASFELNGQQIRVIGGYETETENGQDIIFLPLDTAQRLFDREGEISALFVTLAVGGDPDRVVAELQDVLGSDVLIRSLR